MITASLIARDRIYGHATITDRAPIVAYKRRRRGQSSGVVWRIGLRGSVIAAVPAVPSRTPRPGRRIDTADVERENWAATISSSLRSSTSSPAASIRSCALNPAWAITTWSGPSAGGRTSGRTPPASSGEILGSKLTPGDVREPGGFGSATALGDHPGIRVDRDHGSEQRGEGRGTSHAALGVVASSVFVGELPCAGCVVVAHRPASSSRRLSSGRLGPASAHLPARGAAESARRGTRLSMRDAPGAASAGPRRRRDPWLARRAFVHHLLALGGRRATSGALQRAIHGGAGDAERARRARHRYVCRRGEARPGGFLAPR